jgi:hypothetical protein
LLTSNNSAHLLVQALVIFCIDILVVFQLHITVAYAYH